MHELNPTLWRTCRVIASETRLNLFRRLLDREELTVTALAGETGVSVSLASIQLRALNARGLISARSVGRWIFYSATPNKSVKDATQIVEAIRAVCAQGAGNGDLIKTATSFTHPRRILIAGGLNGGEKTFPELVSSTCIPSMALYRHLEKLADRHMVGKCKGSYRLMSPEDPLGKTLLAIARGGLDFRMSEAWYGCEKSHAATENVLVDGYKSDIMLA